MYAHMPFVLKISTNLRVKRYLLGAISREQLVLPDDSKKNMNLSGAISRRKFTSKIIRLFSFLIKNMQSNSRVNNSLVHYKIS